MYPAIASYPHNEHPPKMKSVEFLHKPLAPESFKQKPLLRHAIGLFVLGLISFLIGVCAIVLEILLLVQDKEYFPHCAGICAGGFALIMASIIMTFLRIQTNLLSLAVLVISSNAILISLLGCLLYSILANNDIKLGTRSSSKLAKIITLAVLCAVMAVVCMACFIYMCKVNHEFRPSLVVPESLTSTAVSSDQSLELPD